MEYPDNHSLLELVRSGDCAAFAVLYQRERDRVMGFSYKLLRSHEEAKELTQDVFVQLWENREKIDPSKHIGSLLFVMAKHSFFDAQKKKNNLVKYLEHKGTEEPQSNSTSQYIDMLNCFDIIKDAVESLTPQTKKVYTLSRENGFSHIEISKQLAISPNTVNNHIVLSLRHIRRHLNKLSPDTILSILVATSLSLF